MSMHIDIVPSPLVLRARDGESPRRVIYVRMQLTESIAQAKVVLKTNGRIADAAERRLRAGRHTLALRVPEPEAAADCELEIFRGGETAYRFAFRLEPAKPWTLFLMHQSHFDIGYTDLQREIYMLQKKNLDQVLEYIADTKDAPEGGRFK